MKAALFALVLSFPALPFRHGFAQTHDAGKPFDVEVPMRFRGLMPAVEVMVNGRGPFLFAIDTGGQGMARVASSLVERLKLQSVGQVQAGDGSGRNVRSLPRFELDSIALGGVQFKGGRDEFAPELLPEARIRFVRGDGGKVIAINILNRAGDWERAAKDQP